MFEKDRRRWSNKQAFRKWWRRHQGFRPAPPWYWRWVLVDVIADLEKCETTPEAIETHLRKMVQRVKKDRQFFDPYQQSLLFGEADETHEREPSKPVHPGYANYWNPDFDVEA